MLSFPFFSPTSDLSIHDIAAKVKHVHSLASSDCMYASWKKHPIAAMKVQVENSVGKWQDVPLKHKDSVEALQRHIWRCQLTASRKRNQNLGKNSERNSASRSRGRQNWPTDQWSKVSCTFFSTEKNLTFLTSPVCYACKLQRNFWLCGVHLCENSFSLWGAEENWKEWAGFQKYFWANMWFYDKTRLATSISRPLSATAVVWAGQRSSDGTVFVYLDEVEISFAFPMLKGEWMITVQNGGHNCSRNKLFVFQQFVFDRAVFENEWLSKPNVVSLQVCAASFLLLTGENNTTIQ